MAMDFKGLGVCRRVSASVSVCLSLRSVVTWVKHKEKNKLELRKERKWERDL